MFNKLTSRLSVLHADTKVALHNLVRLIEAASLLVVGVYSVYAAHHFHMSNLSSNGLTVAAAIIAVRGAWEFLRHLAQKG